MPEAGPGNRAVVTGDCWELLAAFTLSEEETYLVETCLDSLDPGRRIPAQERFSAINALGAAVARLPTLEGAGEGELDRDSLLQSLKSLAPSARPLHLPSRIVGARSYLIAKCHAFSMLALMVQRQPLHQALRQVILSIICTLLAEDVYFSCLEDPGFPLPLKYDLAADLLSLWKTGSDIRVAAHTPALEALWSARDSSPPGFGSFTGGSELVRLSMDLDDDWRDFLVCQLQDDETLAALEEFLFGLSWEEIRELRMRLNEAGIHAVDHDQVRYFLGGHPAYGMALRTSDPAHDRSGRQNPETIYDFYVDRREMAARRRLTSAPGPHRTLEEMYLRFRLTGRS
ncbi:MAG: hypothetical protein LBQ35_08635 [Spirochaetaceae bacterium]|jgi:hypothetical protein|nr:hypothetical protein [Spirochaetaceae bacterium]